jgi:hypothetical protein
MQPPHGTIQALISAFNVLRPDNHVIETWIGALNSGAYQFGFGLLRDGEDRYDPMGVLAATQVVDWTWEESEGAWAFEGSVDFLPGHVVVRLLGSSIPTSMQADWGQGLSQTITEFNDGVSDFLPTVTLIKQAFEHHRAQSDKRRITLDQIGRERHPTIDGYADSPFQEIDTRYRRPGRGY